MPLTKRGGWPYANPPNTSFTLNTQSPQSRGLVGWWPGESVKFHDYVHGYDGAKTNTATIGDAERGRVTYYDNTAYTAVDYAPVYNLGYQITGPITVSFWAKGGAQSDVCFCLASSVANPPLLMLQVDNFGGAVLQFDVFLRNDANQVKLNHILSTGTAFDSNWHHIVWADNAGAAKVYIDGILDTRDYSYAAGGAYTFNRATWGALRRAAAVNHLTGSLSGMRLYNRILSPAEIWSLYSPSTRWELYAPAISTAAAYVAVAGGLALPIFSSEGVHSTLFGGQVIR